MKYVKGFIKVCILFILILIIGLYVFFVELTSPKSDAEILKKFESSNVKPILLKDKYKGFSYRKIYIQTDTIKPTIVFIHGSVGSLNDYSNYLLDSVLQQKCNMIAYDRIGYNYKDENSVQESITFERDMLMHILKNTDLKRTIIVGYSYGGPIALSVKEKVKNIVLLAPAVYSKVEPMPWALHFYNWRLTRWMLPRVWKQASKEKKTHKKDLRKFEKDWKLSRNNILTIHGDNDWIVPYENSLFLVSQIPKTKITLVTLKNVGHDLLWSEKDFIKQQLLDILN